MLLVPANTMAILIQFPDNSNYLQTYILKVQELKLFYKFNKGQLPHYLQNLPIQYNSLYTDPR